MGDTPLRIVGAPGSPYSRKLRAVLLYRRIPHAWIQRGAPESHNLPQPRVDLLPQLIVPGADGALAARVDSTPLIRELESSFGGRSVIHPDPVVAFIDALLEDYADEWLTKAMFHRAGHRSRRVHHRRPAVGAAAVPVPAQVPAVAPRGLHGPRVGRGTHRRPSARGHRLRAALRRLSIAA